MADCPSRTRSGRRRHWKLPDMIQGVRHRFRDKRRSKSPDCLDDSQQSMFKFPQNGRTGLPRAASMLSTDCGFSPVDWPQSGPVLSDCDLTRSGPSSASSSSYHNNTAAKAASVSGVNQAAGLSHGISHGSSIQRGKSVRFGENRISVFLQDSTQALEECVRLALSYAEESKRGEYCSDSEAVSLSRSLTQSQDSTVQSAPDRKSANFWSDSEDLRGVKTKSEMKQNSGDYYSNFSARCPEGPPTPTNYKPKSFGQAVNSLDRVERLDRARSHQDKSRKKRSAQINEIFSFIDKILSGCDSGCNDEFCPFVREAAQSAGDSRSKQRSYNLNISSLPPPHYQNRKQFPLPGELSSQSYAYKGKLPTEGQFYDSAEAGTLRSATPHANNTAVAGLISDSDCDTSDNSNLVQRATSGRPPRSRLRRQEQGWAGNKRTTEDVFAQIIICCESNKESLGMAKYGHIHQKISQTVCNAIFLCKVIINLR